MSDDKPPSWPNDYLSPGGSISISRLAYSESKVWLEFPIPFRAYNREQVRKIAEILLAYSETMPASKPQATDSYSVIPGGPLK